MVRSTIAAVAYSVSEAVEEAQWFESVPADMTPTLNRQHVLAVKELSLMMSVAAHAFQSLFEGKLNVPPMHSLLVLSCPLFYQLTFNLCQAVKSDKGTGSESGGSEL